MVKQVAELKVSEGDTQISAQHFAVLRSSFYKLQGDGKCLSSDWQAQGKLFDELEANLSGLGVCEFGAQVLGKMQVCYDNAERACNCNPEPCCSCQVAYITYEPVEGALDEMKQRLPTHCAPMADMMVELSGIGSKLNSGGV